ncbi:Gfo/Idh/MocA family protein [Bauldia sp.]|uniref:Gfo/Idh/MocA family protein n=1 Tax=Bauldia sp. TaxID=2575872 RepID=UPI003BA864AA
MSNRRRFVMVGVGSRARMFYDAIAGRYADTCELVAVCDTNQVRMDLVNKTLAERFQANGVPTYKADAFDTMLETHKPDAVIVTSIDRTHDDYIVRALARDCDIVTEKPMTVDARRCQRILDAAKASDGRVRVTFNYRYAPHNTAIRDLIADDVIGEVNSVHFEWLLDTSHGADYFRRWHRDKRNSGGLLVHKSTHHFDLVNFWLGAQPETVFAFGDLRFYGRESAERRGVSAPWYRTTGVPAAADSPFSLDLNKSPALKALYLDAEKEDGYFRDLNVFGDGISIEDTMSVLVRYSNRATMTYSLTAYAPWEGFNVAINGSKGRIQLTVGENSYVNAGGDADEEGSVGWRRLSVHPLHAKPYDVELPDLGGSHGGGDKVMLDDLFGPPSKDADDRAADHRDGAMSILTGIAANRSIAAGRPVEIADLVRF